MNVEGHCVDVEHCDVTGVEFGKTYRFDFDKWAYDAVANPDDLRQKNPAMRRPFVLSRSSGQQGLPPYTWVSNQVFDLDDGTTQTVGLAWVFEDKNEIEELL